MHILNVKVRKFNFYNAGLKCPYEVTERVSLSEKPKDIEMSK